MNSLALDRRFRSLIRLSDQQRNLPTNFIARSQLRQNLLRQAPQKFFMQLRHLSRNHDIAGSAQGFHHILQRFQQSVRGFIENLGFRRSQQPLQQAPALVAEVEKSRGPYKVSAVAERAGVAALTEDREWVGADRSGVRLRKPGALLDAWCAVYKPRLTDEKQYYTLLHGEPLDNAAKAATVAAGFGRHLLLASFSAARWLAPYARMAGYHFYADAEGEARLKTDLKLEPSARGANVTVARPMDDGAFMGRREPVQGLWCTGPVQTYLDLSAAGERGREAADHLRKKVLDPLWLNLP